MRTRQFVRGINEAIKEKMKTKKPLHILYAGTGPFATLILPIIFKYSTQEIKYTFLEINPLSFNILQNVMSKIGLANYDITLVNSDATQYKIDPENEPDIIVSETMQNALAKEQQVPLFLNLMSQVKNDVLFIPEKIELFIGLKKAGIPIEKLQRKHYHKERSVFDVSRAALFPSGKSKKDIAKEVSFAKKQTIIEPEKLKEFDRIAIITEIQVYKDEKIRLNDSGLTTPIFIKEIPENLQSSITIDTEYTISAVPNLNYQVTLAETI